MLFKKNLDTLLIRFKTMGKMAFVPLIVLFIILPVIFINSYMIDMMQDAVIMMLTSIFVPILSVWWVLMFLKEFIESDGNEVLFVYGKKSQLSSVIILSVLYMVCVCVLLCVCGIFFPTLFLWLLCLLMTCVLNVGLAYFLAFLTRSIAITFVPILFIAALPFINRSLLLFDGGLSWEKVLIFYLPQALVGVLFMFLGHLLNKKKLKFN